VSQVAFETQLHWLVMLVVVEVKGKEVQAVQLSTVAKIDL
jgi:hypothetical protein